MAFHKCVALCSRFIMTEDKHNKCVKCLGFSHAQGTLTHRCFVLDKSALTCVVCSAAVEPVHGLASCGSDVEL